MDVANAVSLLKLTRPDGLCVNVVYGDSANANRIKTILDIYTSGVITLYRAKRESNEWEECVNLPVDFESYKYRINPPK
jgi:hypothetical protein